MAVSLVDVWVALSMLVQRMVVPWYTVMGLGEKAKFWMATSVVRAGQMEVGEGVGVPCCCVGVLVTGVTVPQFVRVKRKPQPLRVPTSAAALSLTVRTHRPFALWPSSADNGLSGR